MLCNKCGKEISDSASFCNFCGNPVGTPSETVNAQPVQPQSVAAPATPVAPVSTPVVAPVAQPVAAKKSGLSGAQKGIIIGLLLVVVVLLGIVVLFTGGTSLHDGSRTIMIYVVGSNLETDSGIVTVDLDSIDPEEIDLSKTNVLLYTGGTEKWHNFVQNDENAIYILQEDGFEKLESQKQLNMGAPDTLADFLNYAVENYKTEKYDLILYNHGGAVDGAIYDDISSDNLSLDDMAEALKSSKFSEKKKLEAVLFRTCLNGTIEVANVFAPYSNYLIGSEETSYGSSYTDVLSFINNLEKSDNGKDFGIKFVDSYQEQMDVLNPKNMVVQTYSVIDLSKIGEINKELDKFIEGIDLEKDYKNISKIRANIFQYGSDVASFDMIDLYEFVEEVSKYSSVNSDNLLNAIDEAVVYNKSNDNGSHGLSIYFPYKGKAAMKAKYLAVYKDLGYSETYRKFITKYNSMQTDNKASYSINLEGTKPEKVAGGREASLQLTPEQMENLTSVSYLILQKNREHPDYYYYVYLSNDYSIDENGLVTTNITGNIPMIEDEGEKVFFYMNYTKSSKEVYTNNAVVYNLDSGLEDIDSYVASATFYYYREENDLMITNAKLRSSDERINGTLVDLEKFNYAEVVFPERRILDENGKVMDPSDWEASPYINAVKFYPFQTKVTFSSLDNKEEYYCLFILNDVGGNSTLSELVKVGG